MTAPQVTASLPDETRVGRTALRVADLDEQAAFYGDVVGLDVLERGDDRATLGAGGTPLLRLTDAPDAPPRDSAATGLFHAAFRVPTRAALGDALWRVRERWRLDGASDHRVSEALYLDDPEGNGVEIYRDYPRESWPEREDGTVGMTTEPLDLDRIASAADGADGAPPETDVGHVHLEVASLERAESFYGDALGFATRATTTGACFLAAGGYHHHVGANTWEGRTARAEGRGLAWFEVVVPDGAALDAVRRRLADAGVSVEETADGIAATDPDGVEVRLRAESA
ncbi:MAG: VOC family protein [Haloferacaceae archaeon]